MMKRNFFNESFMRKVFRKKANRKKQIESAHDGKKLFQYQLCAKSLSVKNWSLKIGPWGKEAFDCELCEKRFNLIVWHKQCSSITPRGWWHGEKICISHHTSVKITLTFCTYLYTAKLGQDVCCLTNNNNVLAKDQYPVYFRGFQLDDCVFQSGLNFENFQGRNLRNFWWAFWEKRWPHKFILNLTDL